MAINNDRLRAQDLEEAAEAKEANKVKDIQDREEVIRNRIAEPLPCTMRAATTIPMRRVAQVLSLDLLAEV